MLVGNVVVEIVKSGNAMAIEKVDVVVRAGDPESVSVTAKVGLPAVVGMPVIAPVDALRVRPAGRFPLVTDHAYGGMPPSPANVVAYAVPDVPAGSGPAAVIIAGFTGTFSTAVAVTLESAMELAVMVTLNAVATLTGAVYVTAVFVEIESTPQDAPVHAFPLRVHVKPEFFVSFTTVAARLEESPGSTLAFAGPWIVMPVGLLVLDEPPQPTKPASRTAHPPSSATQKRDALDRERPVVDTGPRRKWI